MRKFLILLLLPLLVYAHRVDVYAEYYNGKIDIFGYFSDGTPAKHADVKLYSPNGKLLFEGKTDQNGRLEVPPPKGVKEVKIVLYAGLGHKAETVLSLSNQTAQETASEVQTSKTERSNQTQRGENPPKPHLKPAFTWKEIFCGFGWILGIFGLIGFLKCRKSNSR